MGFQPISSHFLNRVELVAILVAIRNAESLRDLQIFSDSLTAIRLVRRWTTAWVGETGKTGRAEPAETRISEIAKKPAGVTGPGNPRDPRDSRGSRIHRAGHTTERQIALPTSDLCLCCSNTVTLVLSRVSAVTMPRNTDGNSYEWAFVTTLLKNQQWAEGEPGVACQPGDKCRCNFCGKQFYGPDSTSASTCRRRQGLRRDCMHWPSDILY